MKEVKQRKRKLVYLSIPIKNNPSYMFSLKIYREFFRTMGYSIADPSVIVSKYIQKHSEVLELSLNDREKKLMLECLKVLASCDLIYFVKSKINSDGVEVERWFAKRSGIKELTIGVELSDIMCNYTIKSIEKKEITDICKEICKEMNLNFNEIFIKKLRTKHYPKFRWAVMFQLKNIGLSLNEIKDILDCDHTTVIQGIRRFEYESNKYRNIYSAQQINEFNNYFSTKLSEKL